MRLAKNFFFFFQAEDGIRDAQESRGLGDVYKRQELPYTLRDEEQEEDEEEMQSQEDDPNNSNNYQHGLDDDDDDTTATPPLELSDTLLPTLTDCLLYTSDAADEEDSVDLGGRRIIKKKKNKRQNRQI
eukprot:TRINITY_DN9434_c0_g1_i1.p1 TRINITY_DN9434_c0_g1~~TRINITY_DN9434_c0_g1_i1.p1  ORF type:complete len:129 (+),score=65.94 TRINITY_DN9434_c0_g1_i1:66-452(+)